MDSDKAELIDKPRAVDKGNNVLYYHFLMIGVGVLLSWNAICTAFDWMNTKFPGMNASFIFTIINFAPNLIFQPLTVAFGHKVAFNTRIMIPFLAMGIMLAVTPIVVQFSSKMVGFGLMCVISFVVGAFNAVAQTSVFALAGTMPDRYTNAVMVGNGVAGVLINVLRVICLGAFWYESSGLLLSTIVYFIVAGIVLVFCLASQWLLMRYPFVIECAGKTSAKLGNDAIVSPDSQLPQQELKTVDGASVADTEHNVASPSLMAVWRQVWYYACLVFTCYVITFGMFPTVCISTTGQDMNYAWFSVFMFLTFNVCDYLGRNLPALYIVGPGLLGILIFGRFIFWVTFLLVASDQPPTWLFGGHATWFKFINMAVFAVSNGYLSTCCMILGPSQVRAAWKDRAGSIMSTALVWGIFAGSVLALSFTTVAHPPSD